MYDEAVVTPFKLGSSSPTRGWDNHGFLNYAGGTHRSPRNQGGGHDDRGKAHVGFCPRAKFVCPSHLLHFMVHFLLRVAKLCFLLSF